MVYIQAITMPNTGHTMNPLEKLPNTPWLHHRTVLEEPRTRKNRKGLKNRIPKSNGFLLSDSINRNRTEVSNLKLYYTMVLLDKL